MTGSALHINDGSAAMTSCTTQLRRNNHHWHRCADSDLIEPAVALHVQLLSPDKACMMPHCPRCAGRPTQRLADLDPQLAGDQLQSDSNTPHA